jgi:diaminopimelate decarboxylase/aspartate kinase
VSAVPVPSTATTRFIVLKFGGTSVSTKPRWQTIAKIAKSRRDEGAHVVIVVSALSGVTNDLQAIIDAACAGQDVTVPAQALVDKHRAFARELELDATPDLEKWLARLVELANDAPDHASGYAWQAEVLGLGELMSSSIGVRYLRKLGLEIDWLDARDALTAAPRPNQSAWGRRLSVSCATAPDAALSARLSACAPILITQGFIARADDGGTAILGRGGSDTSAAYFGALLSATRVEIWTDVAGMFSANPREVPKARLLAKLDYEEAQEIATTGAKVLHPRCINPCREARVPLLIKDTNRPELEGTEIGRAAGSKVASVKAISARRGITLISMETVGMWQQVGFLADVFAEFKRHGLSIDLIGSAETNVTVSLDPTENLVNSDVVEALSRDLARVCRVKVIAPCAAITMVGRGMRGLLHKLAPVLAEFGAQRVHLISQSSNDLNLTFVVDESVASALIPRLHEHLVSAEAMRLDDAAVFGPGWDELYGAAPPPRAEPWWSNRRAELVALAARGTPRYVYDASVVRATAQRLRHIAAVDRWFYAMKANWSPALLRVLADEGFGIECVSAAELEHVRRELPSLARERILFTPNFAPRDEYAAAFDAGVLVTIDALHPVLHWPELLREKTVALRLDLGYGRGHHSKVVTGGAGSKFGLPLADLPVFRERAKALGVRVVALHAHLGSGVLDVAHFKGVYAELASIADRFPECEALDIGGGLGVPARPNDPALDLDAVAAALAEVKSAYPQWQLWMEPGRFCVAEAGVLVARVTQTKRKGDSLYVGLDAGMNSLIRPTLYEAWHEIVNLSRLGERADALCQVVGPICESGDILGEDRFLPEPREGDVILIAQAGAYGRAMSSTYNLREPAAEVVL